jgi:hypothetical protein
MRRLMVCLVAVEVLCGCSGSGGSRLLDPFSRTTIEPPRTGWITGQPASDPYYSDTRQAGLSSPGSQGSSGWRANSGASALGTAPRYQPPGGDDFRAAAAETEAPAPAAPAKPGDRITIPVAARGAADASNGWADRGGTQSRSGALADDASESPGATAATSSAVAAGAPPGSVINLPPPPDRRATGELTGGDRVVGTIQPASGGSTGSRYGRFSPPTVTRTEAQPRRLDGSPPSVDIMDLPPAGSTSSFEPSTNPGGIRLVSGIEEIDEPANPPTPESSPAPFARRVSGANTSSPRARYAHDPEYRWLRGRLQYSEITGRWKLRYIPVEGRTDEFGGSVVLSNPSQLSGYERGQFVEVHGRLGPTPQGDDQGYAPEFEIAEIQRVDN